MKASKSVVIIPALNPPEIFGDYVNALIAGGIEKIIIVDDGSDEIYKEQFKWLSKLNNCDLITHEENKGKGRALKNAVQYYLNSGYDTLYNGIITVDSDGQHSVIDVIRISDEMLVQDTSLILGERQFDKNVPAKSKFGNYCTRFVFKILYGIKLTDTQTGLRGIPNSLIDEFKDLEGERYEYEMNMLMACSKKKIPIKSITIETIYENDNKGTHFNAVKDSARIYFLLFKNFLKFTISSISASLIDIVIFRLAILLIKEQAKGYILFATAIARICSSLYNYTVNRKLVFGNKGNVKRTVVKYYALCVVQMLASAGLVTLVYNVLPISETITKIVVDTLLFFISYRIQRQYIFT